MDRRGACVLVALTLAAAGVTSAGAAPCATTASCLGAIESAQRHTRALAADFVQQKFLSLLDEPLQSKGRFYFQRPDRVRLDIDAPLHTTVIINGRDVFIPNLAEQDRQAMAMAPLAEMFTQLGAIFTGATETLQRGFEVTAAAAADDGIDVTLIPRAEAWRRLFRRIELHFAGSDLLVRQIQMHDALGDRLEVTLDHVQRNPELSDSLFNVPAATPHG